MSDSLWPSFSVHGDSPGKNTGMGCCFLLQGIFPTQGSNPHLLNVSCIGRRNFYWWTTYQLNKSVANTAARMQVTIQVTLGIIRIHVKVFSAKVPSCWRDKSFYKTLLRFYKTFLRCHLLSYKAPMWTHHPSSRRLTTHNPLACKHPHGLGTQMLFSYWSQVYSRLSKPCSHTPDDPTGTPGCERVAATSQW